MADFDINDPRFIESILETASIFPPEWQDRILAHLDFKKCAWDFGEGRSVWCVSHNVNVLPPPTPENWAAMGIMPEQAQENKDRMRKLHAEIVRGG